MVHIIKYQTVSNVINYALEIQVRHVVEGHIMPLVYMIVYQVKKIEKKDYFYLNKIHAFQLQMVTKQK